MTPHDSVDPLEAVKAALPDTPVLANTGLNGLSFQKPVSPGDRVHVHLTAKRKTQRTDSYGEVAWAVTRAP